MKARKAFFELREVFSGEEVRWAPASHDPSPQFERQGASLGVSAPNTGGAKWIGREVPMGRPGASFSKSRILATTFGHTLAGGSSTGHRGSDLEFQPRGLRTNSRGFPSPEGRPSSGSRIWAGGHQAPDRPRAAGSARTKLGSRATTRDRVPMRRDSLPAARAGVCSRRRGPNWGLDGMRAP